MVFPHFSPPALAITAIFQTFSSTFPFKSKKGQIFNTSKPVFSR